jgi:hypothetical protein
MSYITTIIEDRWREACANPDIRRWKSLSTMAEDMAAAIETHDPDNSLCFALRGIALEAEARMIDMTPTRDE